MSEYGPRPNNHPHVQRHPENVIRESNSVHTSRNRFTIPGAPHRYHTLSEKALQLDYLLQPGLLVSEPSPQQLAAKKAQVAEERAVLEKMLWPTVPLELDGEVAKNGVAHRKKVADRQELIDKLYEKASEEFVDDREEVHQKLHEMRVNRLRKIAEADQESAENGKGFNKLTLLADSGNYTFEDPDTGFTHVVGRHFVSMGDAEDKRRVGTYFEAVAVTDDVKPGEDVYEKSLFYDINMVTVTHNGPDADEPFTETRDVILNNVYSSSTAEALHTGMRVRSHEFSIAAQAESFLIVEEQKNKTDVDMVVIVYKHKFGVDSITEYEKLQLSEDLNNLQSHWERHIKSKIEARLAGRTNVRQQERDAIRLEVEKEILDVAGEIAGEEITDPAKIGVSLAIAQIEDTTGYMKRIIEQSEKNPDLFLPPEGEQPDTEL